MKFAEHRVLSVQATAHKIAHSIDPAGNGFHHQYTQIPQEISKSKSHFTKTLSSPKIHSCMNNRRTLSPKPWILPEDELSPQTSPFKILMSRMGEVTPLPSGSGKLKPFFKHPNMEKSI